MQVGKVLTVLIEKGVEALERAAEIKEEGDVEDEPLPEPVAQRKGKKGSKSKKVKPEPKEKKPVPPGPKPPPIVSIATVVGGLSSLKQKRLLTRGCDILVATPGRLWDLCEEVRAVWMDCSWRLWLTICLFWWIGRHVCQPNQDHQILGHR